MPDRPTYPPPPPPEDEELRERERYGERPSFERIVPELLKRGLEAGRGTLEKNLGDSFFPREVASQLVTSIGDLRQGVVSAVAQEVGLFLREADIASEIRQVMAGLEVEAKINLTFKETSDGGLTTDVRMDNPRRRKWRTRARGGRRSPASDAPAAPDGVSAAAAPGDADTPSTSEAATDAAPKSAPPTAGPQGTKSEPPPDVK